MNTLSTSGGPPPPSKEAPTYAPPLQSVVDSSTPPGLPLSDTLGHLGAPITGSDGKNKKPVSWAKNV